MSIDLPPLAVGTHLVAWLWEVGPTVAAGMGEGPITFAELHAWQALIGIELSAWEARTLRAMSRAYASESHRAKKPDCLQPWSPNPDSIDRVQVARNVRSLLRG